MKNAKDELSVLTEWSNIKAAKITYEGISKILLCVDYTDSQMEDFQRHLDFEYDSGYGQQFITGIIWLKNGSWLERGEYAGMEWWYPCDVPVIPEELN